MSLESVLQTALDPCASGGAHQDIAAQGAVAPYLVWTLITSNINNTLAGASNAQNARVQIDGYATTPTLRRSLGDAIEAALAASSLSNVELTQANHFEHETKLYRITLDFSIWTALPI